MPRERKKELYNYITIHWKSKKFYNKKAHNSFQNHMLS